MSCLGVARRYPDGGTRLDLYQSIPRKTGFPPLERHFDSESLFFADGSLYAITKPGSQFRFSKPNRERISIDLILNPNQSSNALTLIDHHPELTFATAAELSPDGNTLAVLSYTAIWLFERPETGDAWLSTPSLQLPLDIDAARQVEAITWLNDETLVVTNEQRDWFEAQVTNFVNR